MILIGLSLIMVLIFLIDWRLKDIAKLLEKYLALKHFEKELEDLKEEKIK